MNGTTPKALGNPQMHGIILQMPGNKPQKAKARTKKAGGNLWNKTFQPLQHQKKDIIQDEKREGEQPLMQRSNKNLGLSAVQK